jgi:hypothetical protein
VCYAESESDLIGKGDSDSGAPLEPFKLQVPDEDTTRPDQDACDTFGWCWESPGAPGERFYAFSDDRRFAVGERGTVFSIGEGYLEPPTMSTLESVIVIDDQPWVGSGSGVWSYSARGWTSQSEVGVSALAVTPSEQVWAIRGNAVVQLEVETWIDRTPIPEGKEMLFFNDLVANDDGTISVIGSYFHSKSEWEGVLFTWDGSEWFEQAAGMQTGNLRFLEGPATPYVYGLPLNGDETKARVYLPARDWQVVAERDSGVVGTVFWGPDSQWWLAGEDGVFSFDETQSKVPSEVTCGVAINWDTHTVLCAAYGGGLNFVTASDDGVIDTAPGLPAFPAYAAETFGQQPVPVWAQANEAWGLSPSDVWRAPLEHYNGRSWQSLLTSGDTFVAHTIEGVAADDVWFAGENELRHWDGRAVSSVELPIGGAPHEVLSVRALDASHVWVLVETTVEPYLALIFSYSGEGWSTEYQSTIDFTHQYGAIAGANVEDMWVATDHEVLRLQDGAWLRLIDLDPADPIRHAASDDANLWLLTDSNVFRLEGAELVLVGYRPEAMQRLVLSPDYVWNLDGSYVRKLAR